MSTFVIRLVDGSPESFKGKIRHVTTGEEVVFSSVTEMVAFVEGIAAVQDAGSTTERFPDGPSDATSKGRRSSPHGGDDSSESKTL